MYFGFLLKHIVNKGYYLTIAINIYNIVFFGVASRFPSFCPSIQWPALRSNRQNKRENWYNVYSSEKRPGSNLRHLERNLNVFEYLSTYRGHRGQFYARPLVSSQTCSLGIRQFVVSSDFPIKQWLIQGEGANVAYSPPSNYEKKTVIFITHQKTTLTKLAQCPGDPPPTRDNPILDPLQFTLAPTAFPEFEVFSVGFC